MLSNSSRWILAGAWTLIAAAGILGQRAIARIPALDPVTEATLREVRWTMDHAPIATPPLMKRPAAWAMVTADVEATHPFGATLSTWIYEEIRPKPIEDVLVQPHYAVAEAKASLDGVALSWTLSRGSVELEKHQRAKDVKAAAVRIERKTGAGAWKEVARLAPETRAWMDAEVAAGTSPIYRVRLVKPGEVRATEDVGADVEARTPSDRRARLIGGDAKVAIVRVEAYNRKTRAWSGPDRTVRPGEEMWPGGWTLTGLKFKGFGLVAEAAVGDGRTVELTTQD
jgi:hypothetical protein